MDKIEQLKELHNFLELAWDITKSLEKEEESFRYAEMSSRLNYLIVEETRIRKSLEQ